MTIQTSFPPCGPAEMLARLRAVTIHLRGTLTAQTLAELCRPLSLRPVADPQDGSVELLASRELPVADCRGRLELLRGTADGRWAVELRVDRLRVSAAEPPLVDDETVRQHMHELTQAVILVCEHFGLALADMGVRPDAPIADSATEPQPRRWLLRFRHVMTPAALETLRGRMGMLPYGELGAPQDVMFGDVLTAVGGEGVVVDLTRTPGTDWWCLGVAMFSARDVAELGKAVAPMVEQGKLAIMEIGSSVDAYETR
ncbi:hypothetical protein [Catellatospora tritici]|uniref:hypothetical protein n=1 Tax=Catellatospora tritici TaxID=2851566 RepID=UPI001C2CF7BB|nr:hypothetical protein [Catellatospora tritici]MBV1855520.1 hypothetical protein [Catellatospora tritici]